MLVGTLPATMFDIPIVIRYTRHPSRIRTYAMCGRSEGGAPAMQRPEEVKLSRADGEALIERLETNTLNADDRRVLAR